MTELVLTQEQSPALTEETAARVLAVRSSLDEMTVNELHAAILWSQAVAAAGRAKRAWKLAREAAELQIRAERKLGEFLNGGETHDEVMSRLAKEGVSSPGRPREIPEETATYVRNLYEQGLRPSEIARRLNEEGVPSPRGAQWHPPGITRILSWGRERSLIDPRDEGAYAAVAAIPEDLFNRVVEDLLERGKSVDPRIVLKISRLESLELVEPGIHRSWDGAFYTHTSARGTRSGYRRSRKTSLAEVREELYEEERLTKKPPRTKPSKKLDEAFAEARRDAQALSALGENFGINPVSDLLGEAELLQAKVASLLFQAFREFQIYEKKMRPMRIPK